jgi:DNA-binding CsgD family transcriptional regulator
MSAIWVGPVGAMIETIGSDAFPASLAEALRTIAPADFIVAFGYVGTGRPLHLYDDFPPDRRRLHVEEYLEGPYLLDPFYLASQAPARTGLVRMAEIAPDRFYQGEYFRSYYGQTGLAEEIGYLVDVNASVGIVVSLMRRTKRFAEAEMRRLREVWPIVSGACRRHWRDLPPKRSRAEPEIARRVARAFRDIGRGQLTPRETEIVEHTLRGHSAEAVGRLLGISAGTVRIHRRNVYAKLRIASQGDLFSKFIQTMLRDARRTELERDAASRASAASRPRRTSGTDPARPSASRRPAE